LIIAPLIGKSICPAPALALAAVSSNAAIASEVINIIRFITFIGVSPLGPRSGRLKVRQFIGIVNKGGADSGQNWD
jgi:hypothetical protein